MSSLTYLINVANSCDKIQRGVILFVRSVIVSYDDFWYRFNDKIFIGRNVLLFVNQELYATEIKHTKNKLTMQSIRHIPVAIIYFNRAACVVLQVVFNDCKTNSLICSMLASTNSADPSVSDVRMFNSN